ncbi:hypothetical protein CKM354_001190600 [Cercospora kikuchii]|uniref:SAP domain-containing protein n=1 Tax=Cercospora kikuchii TaxID=84275 RepID=A0A9P3CWB5_9PEZI|nr:uncharacterized protein CKM354_001190600 [Cercospora kikuchii]GIZ48862.1 hypothetical protein CKM354_001190600 [Cercospora kikuchii]
MNTSAVLSIKRDEIVDLQEQTKINPITAKLFMARPAVPDDDDESDCDDEELTNTTADRAIGLNIYILKISGFSLDAPYSRELDQRVEEVAKKLGQEKVGSNVPRKTVDDMIEDFGVFEPSLELSPTNAEAYGLQVESVFAELDALEAMITRYENGYIEIQFADVKIEGGDVDSFLHDVRVSVTDDLDTLEDPSNESTWNAASAALINLRKKEKNREARERKAAKAEKTGQAQNIADGATKKTVGTKSKRGPARNGPSQHADKTPEPRQQAHRLQREKQATPEDADRNSELLRDDALSNNEDEDELERLVRQELEEAETDSLFEGDFNIGEEPLEETKETRTTPEEVLPPVMAPTRSRKRGADGDTTDAETARPAKMAKAAHTPTALVPSATNDPTSQAPWSLALPSKVPTKAVNPAVTAHKQAIISEPSTTQPPATASSGNNASKRVAKRLNEKRDEVPHNNEIKKACRSGFDDLKKNQITAWCRIHGIPISGTKDDIERRVEEFITEHGEKLDGFYGTIPGAEALQRRGPNAPPTREAQVNQPTRADQGIPQPPAQPANVPSSLQTFVNTTQTQQVAAAQVNPFSSNTQAPRPHASAPQPAAMPFQQSGMATAAQAPSAEPQMPAVSTNTQDEPTTEKSGPAPTVQTKVIHPGLPFPVYQRTGNSDWSFSGDRKHRTPAALEIINQCNRYSAQPQVEADLSNYSAAELRNFLRSVGCQDVRSASPKRRLQQFARNWFQVYMKGDAGPISGVELLVDEKKPEDAAEPDAPAEEQAEEVQQRNAVSSSAPVAATSPAPSLSGQRARKAKVGQPSQVMLQAHAAQKRVMHGQWADGDFRSLALGSASGIAGGIPLNKNFPVPAAPSLNRTADGRIDSHQNRPQKSKFRRDEQTLGKLQETASDRTITILDDDEELQKSMIEKQTPVDKEVIMIDIDENAQQPVTQAQTQMPDASRVVLKPRPSGDLSMNMPALDRVGNSGRITKNARPRQPLGERELAKLQTYVRNHPEDVREGAAEDLQTLVDAQTAARRQMQQSSHPSQPGVVPPAGYHNTQTSAVSPQGYYTPQSPGLPAANLAYQQDTWNEASSMSAGRFMPPQGYRALQQPEQQQWQQQYAGQHYQQPGQFYHPPQQPAPQQWQQQYDAPQYQQPGQSYHPRNQGPYNSQYGYDPNQQYRQ